jgi:hypothetical protein
MTTLEADPGATTTHARAEIHQDGHQITSTVCHAATLHLNPCSTTINCLPLVYKRRRRPLAAGTTDSTTTCSSALTPDIGICLNQLAGTWRLLLLSRLACSPLYEHHGALQYSAMSAPLLDVRPTAGTRINLMSHCCLALAIKRPISAHLLVTVGTTFRADSWRAR